MNNHRAIAYLKRASGILDGLCNGETKSDCLSRIMQIQKAHRLIQKANKYLVTQFTYEKVSHLNSDNLNGTVTEIMKLAKLRNI